MRSHYKRGMDALHMDMDAKEDIRTRLQRRQRPRPLRLAAVLAAALALVLASTAMASDLPGVLRFLSPALAQSLTPVQRSDRAQDITMTVQSAAVEDGKLTAYITLEDQAGDRLEQGADLYDSYTVNTPYRAGIVLSGCEGLGYDRESGTCGFLVTIWSQDEAGKALDFDGKKFTFSVHQLLLEQTRSAATLSPDWTALPAEPAAIRAYLLGQSSRGESGYPVSRDGTAAVLRPGSWDLPVTEGVSISAAGYLDGRFHLQLRYDSSGPDDHGFLHLVTAEGESLLPQNTLMFRDENGTKYDECVFDLSPEELADCSLAGEFTTGGYLLTGNWQVTFTLDD